MITICPQCQLSLAVSAADLRVAQGHVRCGRCASVFNALVTLFDSEADAVPPPPPPALQDGSETRIFEVRIDTESTDAGANTGVFEREAAQVAPEPPAEPAPDPALDAAAAPAVEAAAVTPADEPAAVGDAPGIDLADDPDATGERPIDLGLAAQAAELPPDPPILPSDAEPLQAPAGVSALDEPLAANDEQVDAPPAANDAGIDEVVAANDPIATTETVDIDLGALAPPVIEDWRVVPQSDGAPSPNHAVETLPVIDLDALPEPEPQADTEPAADEPAAIEPAAVEPEETEAGRDVEADVEALAEPPRPRYYWAYAAGAALLALTLVAQVIHQQREALVAWPRLAGPLSAFYASIGRPIALRGDLSAYDVRQLGAVAAPDAAGTLLVRASLRNLSPRPQPMPLLRVTLQDRYGNRIASRDLTAAEYEQRPQGSAPRALLAAGARLETSVQLVDPGGNAVGFELDACLSERGTTRCANDVTTATAAR